MEEEDKNGEIIENSNDTSEQNNALKRKRDRTDGTEIITKSAKKAEPIIKSFKYQNEKLFYLDGNFAEFKMDRKSYKVTNFFSGLAEAKNGNSIPYLRRYLKKGSKGILPDSEEVFGNWQPPSGPFQSVFIEFKDKRSLRSKKNETSYRYYVGGIEEKDLKIKVNVDKDCDASIEDLHSNLLDSNVKVIDRALREKIYSDISYNGIDGGIENEDATSGILIRKNILDKGGRNENVILKFPPNGDGYWKDYFLKKSPKTAPTRKNFVEDLGLEKETKGFALVPMSYNGHYATFVINLEGKKGKKGKKDGQQIALFDSSLYHMTDSTTDKNRVNRSEALRAFLLANKEALTLEDVKNEKYADILLNSYNKEGSLQGEPQVCGFLNMAFCLEVYRYNSFDELVKACRESVEKLEEGGIGPSEDHFFSRVEKQTSYIVEGEDRNAEPKLLIEDKDFKDYQIPKNSVCINEELGLSTGKSEGRCDEIAKAIDKVQKENVSPKTKSNKQSSVIPPPSLESKEIINLPFQTEVENENNQLPLENQDEKKDPAMKEKEKLSNDLRNIENINLDFNQLNKNEKGQTKDML